MFIVLHFLSKQSILFFTPSKYGLEAWPIKGEKQMLKWMFTAKLQDQPTSILIINTLIVLSFNDEVFMYEPAAPLSCFLFYFHNVHSLSFRH